MQRRAFSLIEITVAIAIGSLILYTAYAGFRVATQTVTVCNRLSLENRLLNAGVMRALEEVDFWTDLDRDGNTPLRVENPNKAISAQSGGYDDAGNDALRLPQPFTSFAAAWNPALNQVPGAFSKYAPDWRPDDPKTWYRGDGFLFLQYVPQNNQYGILEEDQKPGDSVWGNYGLFSGLDVTVDQRGTQVPVGAFAGTNFGDFTQETYTFTACQHKGLKYALGFYGWWDYLPANAVLDWYDRNGNEAIRTYEQRCRAPGRFDSIVDTRPKINVWPGTPNPNINRSNFGQFSLGFGGIWISGSERPMTRSSYLWEQVLCITGPRPGDNPVEALRYNRWMPGHGGFLMESASPINLVLAKISRPDQLVASRPKDWPRVTAEVRRYKIFARTSNDCYVRLFDPATGKMVEIDFRSVGSTLRGARLQRVVGTGGPVLAAPVGLDG